jgi:hypothetical protein
MFSPDPNHCTDELDTFQRQRYASVLWIVMHHDNLPHPHDSAKVLPLSNPHHSYVVGAGGNHRAILSSELGLINIKADVTVIIPVSEIPQLIIKPITELEHASEPLYAIENFTWCFLFSNLQPIAGINRKSMHASSPWLLWDVFT